MFKKIISYFTIICFINSSCILPAFASQLLLDQNSSGQYHFNKDIFKNINLDNTPKDLLDKRTNTKVGTLTLNNQGVQGEHHLDILNNHDLYFSDLSFLDPYTNLVSIHSSGTLIFSSIKWINYSLKLESTGAIQFLDGLNQNQENRRIEIIGSRWLSIKGDFQTKGIIILSNVVRSTVEKGAHFKSKYLIMNSDKYPTTQNYGTITVDHTLQAKGKWLNDRGGTINVGHNFQGDFEDYKDSGNTTINGIASITTKAGFMDGRFYAACGILNFTSNWNIPERASFITKYYLSLFTQGKLDLNANQLFLNAVVSTDNVSMPKEIANQIRTLKRGIFVSSNGDLINNAKIRSDNTSINMYAKGKYIEGKNAKIQSGLFKGNNVSIESKETAKLNALIKSYNNIFLKSDIAILNGIRQCNGSFFVDAHEIKQHKDDKNIVHSMFFTAINADIDGQNKLDKKGLMHLDVKETLKTGANLKVPKGQVIADAKNAEIGGKFGNKTNVILNVTNELKYTKDLDANVDNIQSRANEIVHENGSKLKAKGQNSEIAKKSIKINRGARIHAKNNTLKTTNRFFGYIRNSGSVTSREILHVDTAWHIPFFAQLKAKNIKIDADFLNLSLFSALLANNIEINTLINGSMGSCIKGSDSITINALLLNASAGSVIISNNYTCNTLFNYDYSAIIPDIKKYVKDIIENKYDCKTILTKGAGLAVSILAAIPTGPIPNPVAVARLIWNLGSNVYGLVKSGHQLWTADKGSFLKNFLRPSHIAKHGSSLATTGQDIHKIYKQGVQLDSMFKPNSDGISSFDWESYKKNFSFDWESFTKEILGDILPGKIKINALYHGSRSVYAAYSIKINCYNINDFNYNLCGIRKVSAHEGIDSANGVALENKTTASGNLNVGGDLRTLFENSAKSDGVLTQLKGSSRTANHGDVTIIGQKGTVTEDDTIRHASNGMVNVGTKSSNTTHGGSSRGGKGTNITGYDTTLKTGSEAVGENGSLVNFHADHDLVAEKGSKLNSRDITQDIIHQGEIKTEETIIEQPIEGASAAEDAPADIKPGSKRRGSEGRRRGNKNNKPKDANNSEHNVPATDPKGDDKQPESQDKVEEPTKETAPEENKPIYTPPPLGFVRLTSGNKMILDNLIDANHYVMHAGGERVIGANFNGQVFNSTIITGDKGITAHEDAILNCPVTYIDSKGPTDFKMKISGPKGSLFKLDIESEEAPILGLQSNVDHYELVSNKTPIFNETYLMNNKTFKVDVPSLPNIPNLMQQKGQYKNWHVTDLMDVRTRGHTHFPKSGKSASKHFSLETDSYELREDVILSGDGIVKLYALTEDAVFNAGSSVSAGFYDIYAHNDVLCKYGEEFVKWDTPNTKGNVKEAKFKRVTFTGGEGCWYEYTDPIILEKSIRRVSGSVKAGNKIEGPGVIYQGIYDVILDGKNGVYNGGIAQVILTDYKKDKGFWRDKYKYTYDTEFFEGAIRSDKGKVIIVSKNGKFVQQAGVLSATEGIDNITQGHIETLFLQGKKGTETIRDCNPLTEPFQKGDSRHFRDVVSTMRETILSGPVRHISREGKVTMPGIQLYAPNSEVHIWGKEGRYFSCPILKSIDVSSGGKTSFHYPKEWRDLTSSLSSAYAAFQQAAQGNFVGAAITLAKPRTGISWNYTSSTINQEHVGPGFILAGSWVGGGGPVHQTNGFDIHILGNFHEETTTWYISRARLESSSESTTTGLFVGLNGVTPTADVHGSKSKTKNVNHRTAHLAVDGTMTGNIDTLEIDQGVVNIHEQDGKIGKVNAQSRQNTSETNSISGSVSVDINGNVSASGSVSKIDSRLNPTETAGLYVDIMTANAHIGGGDLKGADVQVKEIEEGASIGEFKKTNLSKEKKGEGYTIGLGLNLGNLNGAQSPQPAGVNPHTLFDSVGNINITNHHKGKSTNYSMPIVTGVHVDNTLNLLNKIGQDIESIGQNVQNYFTQPSVQPTTISEPFMSIVEDKEEPLVDSETILIEESFTPLVEEREELVVNSEQVSAENQLKWFQTLSLDEVTIVEEFNASEKSKNRFKSPITYSNNMPSNWRSLFQNPVIQTYKRAAPLFVLGSRVLEERENGYEWHDAFGRGSISTGIDALTYGGPLYIIKCLAGIPAAAAVVTVATASNFVPVYDSNFANKWNSHQIACTTDELSDEFIVPTFLPSDVWKFGLGVKYVATKPGKATAWVMEKIDQYCPWVPLALGNGCYYYNEMSRLIGESLRYSDMFDEDNCSSKEK